MFSSPSEIPILLKEKKNKNRNKNPILPPKKKEERGGKERGHTHCQGSGSASKAGTRAAALSGC